MPEDQEDFEIAFFERLIQGAPNFVEALAPLAELYTKKGRYEKGLQIDKRLARLRPGDAVVHYNLACSYALVGKKEEAFETLERAIRLGYDDFDHLKRDPDLKGLHEEPRFQALFLTKK